MDTQHPKDFQALCDMVMELKAEVARWSAVLGQLAEDGISPTFPLADLQGDSGCQLAVGTQQTVIKVPAITTVELQMPEGTSHFYHKCYMCKARFPSSFREPKQCPTCGSHRWPDGKTKWDRRKANPLE